MHWGSTGLYRSFLCCTYDAAGRRTSMTVLGQSAVNYTYDDANRLTQITQGTAVVALVHDAAGRRTTLTLPNGVIVDYSYDAAGQLTGLTYSNGTTTLGTLAYTYDAAGNRTEVDGTWARTGLPQSVASATYDTANQMLTFGSQTLTYDANGNLTDDGSKTYTWNARNQLLSMTGASFGYDGLGRRLQKTVGGPTTDFLYDGVNPVQELSGGTPTANILTGLGIDEYFTRGTETLLTDALGSTVALTDSSGTVLTDYTYEPFGATTATGTASANSFTYTGRENDETGLYYYRARYYHPGLQRFITEDPIGFFGGDINFYAYVFNNPSNWSDPLGLDRGPKCQVHPIICFVNEYGEVAITFNWGAGLGITGKISITNEGISGFVGVGAGIGTGIAVTGGGTFGSSSGWGVTLSGSGGTGRAGAAASGTVSQGGTSGGAGVGWGLGAGVTLTGGYGGTIVDF